MIKFEYVIQDVLGIHARPAGLLVREATKYQSSIILYKDDKMADAKKIFNIMKLGVKCGNVVTIKIDGEDEKSAAEGIFQILKTYL